ncbi:hypothetical protein ACIBCH_36685 [Amycolatopsis thailandensis]|uniref:hypothetical protein n=1 Tax=Amycolatopsis thailandensis TaxID=589330 RepID=UPI003798880F
MKTREEIVAEYREQFPIVAAYLDTVIAHSAFTSINQPADGIDRTAATRIAMQRIGRPARDDTDVEYAETYIRRILEEMETLMPPEEMNLPNLVMKAFFPLSGHVPTAGDWSEYDQDDRNMHIDDVIQSTPDHTDDLKHLLRQALQFGMPSILAQITANDLVKTRGLTNN